MPATLGIDETGAQVDQQQQLLLMAAKKRYAWIEIGGGTGENIEKMNKYFPIANFHRVYLIDITPSLCEIARKR